MLHCRESLNETIEIIEKVQDGTLKGIFHCFSGNAEQAKKIFKIGFCIGLGGVVTFKNGGLDKVLGEITLDNAVLETDSPYLAPVPHRGKRNEPDYIPLIASKVAALTHRSEEEVRNVTTENAMNLFNHTL